MTILFYISVFLVIYAYVGYPLVLWVTAKIKPRHVRKGHICPAVSVIIAARNESDKIRQKIEHTLGLIYPKERLSVLVASDASDDGTDEIVQEYATRGVTLVRAPRRGGKEYAQGLAVAAAKGEILVFTDAATILEPDTLSRLVQNFSDPTIGAVSTEDLLVDSAGTPSGEGLYVKYEMWVRRLESCFHSLVGLSGSCFAIRRQLCANWSPNLASDFMGALRAARQGHRSIADPSVRGRFPAVISAQHEVRRKVRTFLRGITVLMANLDMLNPFRYGRFAFQLASHKLLRFLVPFFLLTILATTILLIAEQPFRFLFWMQFGLYALGIIGALLVPLQQNRVVRLASFFAMVQWAMLVAWTQYLRGRRQVAWDPSRRPGRPASDHAPTR